ncbi:hypothetical protein BRADI_1g51466v3 [Brachypodium distachyon]|uniref:Uncharacterized protein n=1 Tax=Brachypodium distachyon TaxID=15368 RepID=A0A2K2DQX8_BRADI|nr:hypothetical protein BRADI_1g51466v3 [Brachypodium distachyon]
MGGVRTNMVISAVLVVLLLTASCSVLSVQAQLGGALGGLGKVAGGQAASANLRAVPAERGGTKRSLYIF